MRIRFLRPQVIAAAFSVLSLGLFTGSASAAGQGIAASASGSGHYLFIEELRTFAFTAHTDAAGVSSGQAQINNRDQGRFGHIVIDCLYVNGNEATMSGIVSTSSDPGIIGAPVFFRVIDNGEGRKAPAPDQVSAVHFLANTCDDPNVGLPLNDVLKGNVQVR